MNKTTIAISAVFVAALVACADKPPARQPTASTTETSTTTTTSGPYPRQQSHQHESASSLYGQPTPGTAPATMGSNEGTYPTIDNDGTVRKTPLAPPPEPALNEPDANVRPAPGPAAATSQPLPGPATATAPDGKSPNKVAVTDQGNSKSEVQISSRIRKALVASNTLSFGAKNAKVITQGTKVTLRGNVKTDAEKNEIEGVARSTDGVTEVENQLVVKK